MQGLDLKGGGRGSLGTPPVQVPAQTSREVTGSKQRERKRVMALGYRKSGELGEVKRGVGKRLSGLTRGFYAFRCKVGGL